MNKKVSLVVNLVLLVAVVILGYNLYEIIQEPVRFQKIKEQRYTKIKERLEQIRDVQKTYRAEYNEFAKDLNSLIAFVDTGKQSIIVRKDSSFMYYDEVFQQERSKDTTIVRVLGYKNVKESLFGSNFDANKLQYIPMTENKFKFEMEANKIKVGDVVVPVFEARAPNVDVFADIMGKYSDFIDKDYGLKVGSMTEPTLSGNWK
ncbi:hypothetical protein [Owenweeksia hongkongensis]|uniref:hypothetical protein n=1 Tax=Owenweeksia hongkongensis TaxID=253245 RepID=UPI003A93C39A